MVKGFRVQTRGQGLYEVTDEVASIVHQSDCSEGLCTVFIRHTSASLIIQENADPSARADLERWLNRLVPENDRTPPSVIRRRAAPALLRSIRHEHPPRAP